MSVLFELTQQIEAELGNESGEVISRDVLKLPPRTRFIFIRREPYVIYPDSPARFYTIKANGQLWVVLTKDLDGHYKEVPI